MRIDIISALFIAIVAFASIPLTSSKALLITLHIVILFVAALNAGLVGLALTYAISLNGTFQYCVRQSAEVESLVCCDR